ncbi:hypothetical protein BH18ACI5_BH18ACI5_22930 [soil metagenome]
MADPTALQRARLAKGLDLAAVAARTRLSPGIVRKIDEGRFAGLPGGLYARSYIRAFAAAVGLSPAETLEALEGLLPPAPDPIPLLNELAPPSPLDTFKTFIKAQGLPWKAADLTLRNLAAVLLDAAVLMSIGTGLVAIAAWSCDVSWLVLLDQANVELALLFSVPVLLYVMLFERLAGQTPGQAICSGRVGPVRVRLSVPHRLPRTQARKLLMVLRPVRR